MKLKTTLLRAIATALLLSLALFALVSCSGGNKFVPEGTLYKDKKNKVSYVYAPLSFEPIAIGEEIYAQSEYDTFYTIVGQDPLKWVCEESGTVFHAKDIPVPALDEMALSYIDVCAETATATTVKATIENTDDISAIVDGYLSAESLEYLNVPAELVYKIRFADTSLCLYYSVSFLRYSDDVTETLDDGTVVNHGKDFIYNNFEGRFIPAPEALTKHIDAIK